MRYSDIVILMRSMTWSQEVTDQFKEADIPLYTELSKGYFEAIEVLIMIHTFALLIIRTRIFRWHPFFAPHLLA